MAAYLQELRWSASFFSQLIMNNHHGPLLFWVMHVSAIWIAPDFPERAPGGLLRRLQTPLPWNIRADRPSSHRYMTYTRRGRFVLATAEDARRPSILSHTTPILWKDSVMAFEPAASSLQPSTRPGSRGLWGRIYTPAASSSLSGPRTGPFSDAWPHALPLPLADFGATLSEAACGPTTLFPSL